MAHNGSETTPTIASFAVSEEASGSSETPSVGRGFSVALPLRGLADPRKHARRQLPQRGERDMRVLTITPDRDRPAATQRPTLAPVSIRSIPHATLFHRVALGLVFLSVCPFPLHCAGPAKGRNILRNGDLRADARHPIGWVVRDSVDLGRITLQPSEEDPDSRVVAVDIKAASSTRPYTVELRQSLAAPLYEGEILAVSFDFKLTEGYVFNCYWQKDSPPWPKFIAARLCEPVNQWHRCKMAAVVPEDLEPRATSLTFHLAAKTGKVQFRDFAVTTFPASAALEDIPINCDAAVGGDYYDTEWEKEVLERIRKIRRSRLRIMVTNEGKPVPNTTVHIRQKRRDFLVAVEVPAPLLDDELLKRPEFAELRGRLKGAEDKLPEYRQKVLAQHLFNFVSFREALLWRANAAWGDAVVLPLLDRLTKRQREVVELVWLQSRSRRDAAHQLGITEGALRFHEKQALDRLKEEGTDHG